MNRNNSKKSDAIIILAGGINIDRSLPKSSKERVKTGVDVFKSGLSDRIIMSGKWSFLLEEIPATTEAKAMKKYATSLGVNPEKILLEETSQDTIGNAYFCKSEYLEVNDWRNLIVVTSKFHVPRTKFIFNSILGESYNIHYKETVDTFSERLPKTVYAHEAIIFKITKNF